MGFAHFVLLEHNIYTDSTVRDWKVLNVCKYYYNKKKTAVNLNYSSLASNNDTRLQRLFPPREKNTLLLSETQSTGLWTT